MNSTKQQEKKMDILKIQMQYEAEKRNGFAAAVLNLIIPVFVPTFE